MRDAALMSDAFPRQNARTRGFRLGEPRSFEVAPDGSRVAFLRSARGDDPVNSLWVFDVESGTERLVADAAALGGDEEHLSQDERARRERARERAGGIVAYAVDADVRVAAFALGGALHVADLVTGEVRPVVVPGAVFDPRPDPQGERVAYVSDGDVHVVDADGNGADVLLAHDDDEDVRWGMAEFVAAEEMGRSRGYWWAPDGRRLAAARVDDRALETWHIADPVDPTAPPRSVRYPVTGGDNSVVTLHVLDLDGRRTAAAWDRERFPYLVAVSWSEGRPLTLLVQSRDQRAWQVLAADTDTGETRVLHDDSADRWMDIVPGVPAWRDDGALVFVEEHGRRRRLTLDGAPATPETLHVRRVVHVGTDVVFAGTEEEPEQQHLWRLTPDGEVRQLTADPGIHDGSGGGDVLVVATETFERVGARTVVMRGDHVVAELGTNVDRSPMEMNATFLRPTSRELSSALFLPSTPHDGPHPVLLDPYGGPHFQRVRLARRWLLESQWFADRGFAVLVVDGRGTPGRDLAWEKAVHHDFASVLDDQVDALHAVAAERADLDLSRVAIRGWSFGGYLAALAVLRRPDVFAAAIAGAPVTDERLYDTHYTERYLGLPHENPHVYERNSLLGDAPNLERPLLLIHGLSDDNVFFAHTLRLSRAFVEAGRPHRVLPLSGITHMASQEDVAESLLLLEVSFLREALA